jgi:hypothetical protein
LRDAEAANAALLKLKGAPLFNEKIGIMKLNPESLFGGDSWPCLRFGWFASVDPDPRNANVRGPALKPPQDPFAAVRQQRRIVFENIPHLPPRKAHKRQPFQAYELLHNFNVTYFTTSKKHSRALPSGKYVMITFFMADFETKDEAELAIAKYHGSILKGQKLHVSKWQIPRRFLGVSWDEARGGEHFSGRRDQGSAIGTNFEEVPIGLTRSLLNTCRLRYHGLLLSIRSILYPPIC